MWGALTVIFLLFAILMGFVIGFGMGYPSLDNNDVGIDVNAFYAEVQQIEAETIIVERFIEKSIKKSS